MTSLPSFAGAGPPKLLQLEDSAETSGMHRGDSRGLMLSLFSNVGFQAFDLLMYIQYHGKPQLSVLGLISPIYWGCKTFIFHGHLGLGAAAILHMTRNQCAGTQIIPSLFSNRSPSLIRGYQEIMI